MAEQDDAPLISRLLEEAPDLVALIDSFVQQLPELLAEIQNSLDRQDWATLKEQIHNLKGLGGGYGYPQVSELAAAIEENIFAGNHASLGSQLGQLGVLEGRIRRGLTGV